MWTTTPSDRRVRAGALATSLLALLFVGLEPRVAHAEEPPFEVRPDAAPANPVTPAPAASDPLDTLRGRFREGMEKYRAGAYADAIVIWESIYRELGAEKGYRVAFDLGRAYEELGELIKSAEHYQTYLDRVAVRRRDGESLEPNVEKQEAVAHERIERIVHIYGAIKVRAGTRPVIAHVDNTPARVAGFTVYVEPGAHTVRFGSGPTADVRTVTVRRGEQLEIEPREEATPAEVRYETHVDHPFSTTVLWVGAGVAVASLVVPVISYANALAIKKDFDSTSASREDKVRLEGDYQSARSNAYYSIIAPVAFTATVGGLALWYVLGRTVTRTVVPTASISSSGVSASLTTRF